MTSNITVLYLVFGGILITLGLNIWQALLAAVIGNVFYVLVGIAATPGPKAAPRRSWSPARSTGTTATGCPRSS